MKRPCLDCGRVTTSTRCYRCERQHDQARGTTTARGYDTEWRKSSEQTRRAWVEQHGWICPGWRRDRHPSRDLVVDHDVSVLCRSCNAVKAATFDKQRGRAGQN